MAKRKKPGTKLQQIPARTQLRPGEESIEEKARQNSTGR